MSTRRANVSRSVRSLPNDRTAEGEHRRVRTAAGKGLGSQPDHQPHERDNPAPYRRWSAGSGGGRGPRAGCRRSRGRAGSPRRILVQGLWQQVEDHHAQHQPGGQAQHEMRVVTEMEGCPSPEERGQKRTQRDEDRHGHRAPRPAAGRRSGEARSAGAAARQGGRRCMVRLCVTPQGQPHGCRLGAARESSAASASSILLLRMPGPPRSPGSADATASVEPRSSGFACRSLGTKRPLVGTSGLRGGRRGRRRLLGRCDLAVRIGHEARRRSVERGADIHAMDLACLLPEPGREGIIATRQLRERSLRVLAL